MERVLGRVQAIVVGAATSSPRVAYQVVGNVECDCPHCFEGEHEMPMRTGSWFYDTREEAEEALREYGLANVHIIRSHEKEG